MKKVLEELYFGEIQPYISNYNNNPRLKKCSEIADKNEETLLKLLKGKKKKLFFDLINAQNEVDSISAVESFINGFRSGARIIVESIVEF